MTEPSIGHNKPDMAIIAAETTQEISAWMQGVPAIQSDTDARLAKVFIDRGALCIKDLEDERTQKTRPLNDEIKKVNDHYRGPRELLQRVVDETRHRLGRYIQAEEKKRQAIATEARRVAEEAERAAREAERLEQESYKEADSGVLDVDIAASVAAADTAFAEHEKAERQAALADKEAHVKIGGGFRRAVSLKTVETLQVSDAIMALTEMGTNDDINVAIIRAAKAYKRLKGHYPKGIKVMTDRRV